jgi:hypothetical protein
MSGQVIGIPPLPPEALLALELLLLLVAPPLPPLALLVPLVVVGVKAASSEPQASVSPETANRLQSKPAFMA